MGIELSDAGDALTAIVVSDELSKEQGTSEKNHNSHTLCANCGTQLTGKFCHACGQSAHIHRSLLHMIEEVLHGIFHFDTKAWRTIPALLFKPGHLTKHYIEGKRTSYVSPLALFLFLVFTMFFIFSYTVKSIDNDALHIPNSREEIVKELNEAEKKLSQQLTQQIKQQSETSSNATDAVELFKEIGETRLEIRKLKDGLEKMDGKEKSVAEFTQEFELAEKNLASLRALKRTSKSSEKAIQTSDLETTTTSSKDTKVADSISINSASINSASKAIDGTVPDSVSSVLNLKLQPEEIEQAIRIAKLEVKYLRKQITLATQVQAKAEQGHNENTGAQKENSSSSSNHNKVVSSDAGIGTELEESLDEQALETGFQSQSYFPYIDERFRQAAKNPELTLYRMKKNASGLAFLLMPLTLPFLWLLFVFKRKFVMFDHAVFALYSLSFMCLLMSLVAIMAKFEWTFMAVLVFAFAPPIHMYSQLRHAYSLSKIETLWRTIALVFIAMLSLSIFAAIVTIASA
jgi:uncharacterized protein YoxC